MFSGIIQDIGQLTNKIVQDSNTKLTINTDKINASELVLGDSIAVNGVCLTVIKTTDNSFEADVSGETLSVTTLGGLSVGDRLNLEPALTLVKGINGHLVSGHIDDIAQVVAIEALGEHDKISIKTPVELQQYLIKKGSVGINGVSLTINSVVNDIFTLNIVPHTLKSTTLSDLTQGDFVNIEVDVIARYIKNLL